MTTEVTEEMVEAALRDLNSGRQFSAYQQNPAAWMNAIVAWAIKKSANEIRQAEREACAKIMADRGDWVAAGIIRARGES